jgi:hypothetical protein
MKNQFLSNLSFIVIGLLFVTGCKKDKAPAPPPPPTKTELITKASWKFDHATALGQDISSSVNACFKDNIATFSASGNMELDEATTVCTPSYGGTYSWAFQSSETVLHLNAPIFTGGSSDFTVVSIDATNMALSQVMTVSPYPPTTVTVTFKH